MPVTRPRYACRLQETATSHLREVCRSSERCAQVCGDVSHDFGAIMTLDLTTFPRARHAWDMAMPEVSETDFAIIVFREDDRWDADVLPVAVTTDLTGLIRALRQQPSIAGTIGLA